MPSKLLKILIKYIIAKFDYHKCKFCTSKIREIICICGLFQDTYDIQRRFS